LEAQDLLKKDMGVYIHIIKVATHPDYLKQGLATKLIEEQEELAKKNGYKVFIAESYSTIS